MFNTLRSLQLLLITPLLISSCSSNPKPAANKFEHTVDEGKADSITLAYDPKNEDKRIDEFMQMLHKKYAFNGNVLVAKKGKIVYEKAIGWADYLHRDSLKIDSKFELASVTKPFTATAIMMLVEEGKLKLGQDVKEFYPFLMMG